MVFHKFLGKSPFHCQNDRSDNGSASQFDQRKAPRFCIREVLSIYLSILGTAALI